MAQVSTAPVGSITASSPRVLRANAIKVLKITGVRGGRRRRR